MISPSQTNGFSTKKPCVSTETPSRDLSSRHVISLQQYKTKWIVILKPNHCQLTMIRLFHILSTSGNHSLCPCLCFEWFSHATYLYLFTMAFFSKHSHQTSPISNQYSSISGYHSLWPFRRFLCLAPSLCQYIKWPYILTLKGDLLMNTNSDS